MPRVLAMIAPFGGGSLASSSVINGVAPAVPRLRRPAAKMPSHIRFIICPLTLYFQPNTPGPTSSHAAVADDGVGRPEQRMRIGEFRLAVGVKVVGSLHEGKHGLPQRFAAPDFRVLGLPFEQISNELPCRLGMHRPVRDQKRARTRVEEGA